MYETFEAPPEGYHSSSVFHYPKKINYIRSLLLPFSCLVFYIIWKFLRQSLFPGIPGPVIGGFACLALLTADILRSLIQGEMSRLLGYRASLYIPLMGSRTETYTSEPGQFQKRGHAFLIAIAPISIFTLLWIPLLGGLSGTVGDILAFFLCISISRTFGDLYFLWRLLQMPRNTLLYTLNLKEKHIFEPIV